MSKEYFPTTAPGIALVRHGERIFGGNHRHRRPEAIRAVHLRKRRDAAFMYPGAQIGSGPALTLQSCWHFASQETP